VFSQVLFLEITGSLAPTLLRGSIVPNAPRSRFPPRRTGLHSLPRWLELRLKLAGEIADDPSRLHGLAESFYQLNLHLWYRGRYEEALDCVLRSIEYGRAGLARRPHDFESASDLLTGYNGAAHACWELGRHNEALAASAERTAYLRKLTTENPEVPTFRGGLAGSLAEHGSWLIFLKQPAQAVPWLSEAAEVLETTPDADAATLVMGSTNRAHSALFLAGDFADKPYESWPEASRRQADAAVADLKKPVDRGYRSADVIRASPELYSGAHPLGARFEDPFFRR
jgi:hypothetical protein